MGRCLRLLLFVVLGALYVSCATLSGSASGGGAQQRTLKKRLAGHAVRQDYLYEFFPAWQPVYGGIDALAGRTRHPLLKFWALRVDLRADALEFVLTPPVPPVPRAKRPPGAGEVYSTTISGFARANDCIAAINAGPFSPVNARVGEIRTVIGLFVVDGRLLAEAHAGLGALVWYKNGRAAILPQPDAAAAAVSGAVQNAVGGFRV
ncbi:MAG: hypothetical protein LBC72_02595, partial [Spirochaetaceae bacterium]|nr:hypothetical protein [Spirochaetaceae bacterium]